jgi:hypothetical protein
VFQKKKKGGRSACDQHKAPSTDKGIMSERGFCAKRCKQIQRKTLASFLLFSEALDHHGHTVQDAAM